MPGSLHGVHEKIRRAKAHLADLEEIDDAIQEGCLKAIAHHYDHQRGHHVYGLTSVPRIADDFVLILGDAVHNLRTMLDHLAWQIILAVNKTPLAAAGGTNFPIRLQRSRRDQKGRQLPDIQPGLALPLRSLLDEIQPYQRTKPANHPLAVLNALDIGDKHHELLVSVVGATGVAAFGEWDVRHFNIGPYKPDDDIAWVVTPNGADDKFDPSFSFAVRVDDAAAGGWGTTVSAADLLRFQPIAYIEKEVIPRFAHLF